MPRLHSMSQLTILYTKEIRVYVDVGYIADFVVSR
jgi:hypothetical protein